MYRKQYAAQRRQMNREFVDEVNARTVCAHCGSQPIEWHNPEHVNLNRQRFRIGQMVNQPASIKAIRAEIERCTPLCRRCHMREDGRLKVFSVRGMKGSVNGRSKMTEDTVRQARIRRQQGATWSTLAKEFGVTAAAVRFAVVGLTWKHVQ